MRRGDNIPPVSDYAHWNEDAQRVWWEENKYDMLYADEELDDEPERQFSVTYEQFDTEEEAWDFYKELDEDNVTYVGKPEWSRHRDGSEHWTVQWGEY